MFTDYYSDTFTININFVIYWCQSVYILMTIDNFFRVKRSHSMSGRLGCTLHKRVRCRTVVDTQAHLAICLVLRFFLLVVLFSSNVLSPSL